MSHSVAVAKELLASIRRDEHVARQTAYRARKRSTTSVTVGDKLLLCLVWQLCLSAQVLVTVCRGRLRHVAEAAPSLQPYSLGQWLKEIIDRHMSDHDIAPFLLQRPASRVLLRASLLVAEARVVLWLLQTNMRGVAASAQQLASVFRRSWPVQGRSAESQRLFLRMRHSAKCLSTLVKRFRVRWHINWRRLTTRPLMVREDIARKVRPKLNSSFCFLSLWGGA